MSEIYRMHAEMCKVSSNPTRLEILDLLRDDGLTVSDLIKKTGLSQANISQHLSIMRSKGIVYSERDGKNIIYSISNKKIIKAFDIIRQVLAERLKKEHKFAEKMGKKR